MRLKTVQDFKPLVGQIIYALPTGNNAVGYHLEYASHDFLHWYEPLEFDDKYVLLAWAELIPPEFDGKAT